MEKVMPARPDTPTEHLDQYVHYCNQPEFRKLTAPHRVGELLPEVPLPFTEESVTDYFVLVDILSLAETSQDADWGDSDRFVIHTCNDEGFLFYCQGYYEWDEARRKGVLCLGVVFSPEWSSGFVFYDRANGGLQEPRK